MSPVVHLIGSWLVAVATTNNPRDRKLVTWAGVLPDADGLGAVADVVTSWISGKECTFWRVVRSCRFLQSEDSGVTAADKADFGGEEFLERKAFG